MIQIIRSLKATLAVSILLALVTGTCPAGAQTQPPDNRWEFTVAPYVWGPSLDGKTVIRGQEADVDITASDIYDHLDFGYMSMLAARKGDWGFTGDVVWVDLSGEKDMPPVEVNPTLAIFTVQALRRINNVADFTFGVRYNRLDGRIEFKAPINVEVERTRDWVDPVVGVVLRTPGEHRWHATLVADVGGTGSSDTTWQLFPSFGFNVTKAASFELGYRFIDTNYETGEGSDRFEYDVLAKGPAVGFAWRF